MSRVIDISESGALPLSDVINAVVGATATRLIPPTDRVITHLVVTADKGAFRARLGNKTASMPAAVDPTVAVTDGSAGVKIPEGASLVLPADEITVKGYSSTDVLTYYWI